MPSAKDGPVPACKHANAPERSDWRLQPIWNPERRFPSLFEPVHGSAPDIYGKNLANPIGMIWSGAMMLDFLDTDGDAGRKAYDAILAAIQHVLVHGPCSADLGGNASTTELGMAIAAEVENAGL